MIKKILSYILRAPYHLLMVVSFGASIYAAANKIQGIGWGSSVIIGLIILAYWAGIALKED